MVRISKRLEYALIVLKHFLEAPCGEKFTARMICELYKTPFDTTAKVMQIMNNKGILISNQGAQGGYKMGINLDEISYLELSRIINGDEGANQCIEYNCSIINTCNITGPVARLNKHLKYFYHQLSIKSLLSETFPTENILKNNIQRKVQL